MTNTRLTAYATAVDYVRMPGGVSVHDAAAQRRIGRAERIRGFIYYYGAPEGAHRGVTAIVRSNGSDYSALTAALAAGLESGRDDRN